MRRDILCEVNDVLLWVIIMLYLKLLLGSNMINWKVHRNNTDRQAAFRPHYYNNFILHVKPELIIMHFVLSTITNYYKTMFYNTFK